MDACFDRGSYTSIKHRKVYKAIADDCLYGTNTTEALLQQGLNPNIDLWFWSSTSLHTACEHDKKPINVSLIKSLVNHGAIVNRPDFCGGTPLMYAAESHSLEACKFLLSKGADIRATDNHGSNVLHAFMRSTVPEVSRSETIELLYLLLANGAEVQTMNKRPLTPLEAFFVFQSDPREYVEDFLNIMFTASSPLPSNIDVGPVYKNLVRTVHHHHKRQKLLALCMGLHPRLGEESPARLLNSDVLCLVMDHLN